MKPKNCRCTRGHKCQVCASEAAARLADAFARAELEVRAFRRERPAA